MISEICITLHCFISSSTQSNIHWPMLKWAPWAKLLSSIKPTAWTMVPLVKLLWVVGVNDAPVAQDTATKWTQCVYIYALVSILRQDEVTQFLITLMVVHNIVAVNADTAPQYSPIINMCSNGTVTDSFAYLSLQGGTLPSTDSMCRCTLRPAHSITLRALDLRLQLSKSHLCSQASLKVSCFCQNEFKNVSDPCCVCFFPGCVTYPLAATCKVVQGCIFIDNNFTCCHTETDITDQMWNLHHHSILTSGQPLTTLIS